MPHIRHGSLAIAWVIAGLLNTPALGQGPTHLAAQDPPHSYVWSLEQRLREYEQRLSAVEQDKQSAGAKKQPAPEAAAQKKAVPRVPEPQEENPWKDVSSQGWTHRVGGRLLTETVMWTDNDGIPGAQNYVEIRQVRLSLRGTGYGVFDYRIQLDFEPEAVDTNDGLTFGIFGSVGMKDLYVGMHDIPCLGYVRVGHFKVAFSLNQMTSRRDLTFMERYPMADPNGFTPGREIGIQAYNYSHDQNFTWQHGAFFDSVSETAKQRLDDNQGLVVNARGTWTPIYDEPSGGRYLMHLGLAGIYTHSQDGSGRFSQRPEIHEGPRLIDTGAIDADDYTVLGTEFLVQSGPFHLSHEAMWANVNAVGGNNINLYSAYVEAGWFLTGEHRLYNRKRGHVIDMVPFENFWMVPGCCGRGAWEVAARWSYVDFTNAPNASKYNSLNLALNWYWTPRLRAQLNWIQPFTSGAPLGVTHSSILGMRLAAYF